MPVFDPSIPFTLDFTTLFVVAICVTGLLGLLLLFAWSQDRVRALAWWGTAYLIGGASVVIWSVEQPYFAAAAGGHRQCDAVRRLRHDVERGAAVPRPPGAVGRDGRSAPRFGLPPA